MPKKRRRVVLASYFDNRPSRDFNLVAEALAKIASYDIVFLGDKFTGDYSSKLKYMAGIMRQAYYYNTSGAFVIDGNNPVVNICRNSKSAAAIQLWHAAGAFKRFGVDALRRYKLKGYDAVVVTSEHIRYIYAHALNTPLEQVYSLGKARTDILLKKRSLLLLRREMLALYPQLAGKKVVLYAPTFRGESSGDIYTEEFDINRLQELLGKEYALVCKFHPLVANRVKGNFFDMSDDSLYRIFSVTDILLTDYSSVCIEFSLLDKPMILFAPDYEEYQKNRGLYYDLKEIFPGPICLTIEDTVNRIKNFVFDADKQTRFKQLFFDKLDGKAAERIAALIDKKMIS